MNKLVVVLFILLIFTACGDYKKGDNNLTVFHAGSLSVPFKELIEEYEKENPGVKIFAESSGSLDAARKISDMNKECDIIAVADFLVIDKLLVPEHADWNIAFASNEMIIAYTDKSKYSELINSENWYDILLKDEVFVGRSDPNADPCGYRSVFVFKLAEKLYQKQNLANNLIDKKNTTIRPKEVDLIALLETSNIDYLMIYKSVAIQHKLKFVELPDDINLSNYQYEQSYNSVSMSMRGNKPGDETKIYGTTIMYSFTIPLKSNKKEQALQFVEYLINPEKGGKILKSNGMTPLFYYDEIYEGKIPDALKDN